MPTIVAFEPGWILSEAWCHWKQAFEDYVEAFKYSNEFEKTKTALCHVCSDELKKHFWAFNLQSVSTDNEITLKQMLYEFNQYFQDYINEIYSPF